MTFNHYAKMKRIISEEDPSWVIKKINEPTKSKNFKGIATEYPYYYRVTRQDGTNIPFCKFQKIDLFAKTMNIPVEALPVIE